MAYSSNITQSIEKSIQANDHTALLALLQSLSHSEFRHASHQLAEHILPAHPDNFWSIFYHVVPTSPKAYLGTFLRAARAVVTRLPASLFHPLLAEYATQSANQKDKQKCLEALLPLAQNVEQSEYVLKLFASATPSATAMSLYRVGTPLSYYHLFRYLRTIDDDVDTLRRYAIALIKRGDTISFNLACIIQHYFGLQRLPATFSLHLHSYQLAKLEESYEGFISVLKL